jgi:hypothetical protein
MTDSSPTAQPREVPARAAVVNGLVAGLLTIGVATLGAALLDGLGASSGQPAPVAAVSSAFIDRTPPWLKDFAVATFGTNDKRALLVGTVVVLGVGCALIGLLARRRLTWALIVFAALGGVGAAAVLSRPAASLADAIPTVVGTLVGTWFLSRGSRVVGTVGAENPGRRLLIGAAVGGSAAYVGSWWGSGSAADVCR